MVSIIIPNYNHGRFLQERIESVLTQSFSDFECIVLDDASTDNSQDIIKSYSEKDPRVLFCPSDKNSGSTFLQWNKGVKMAKNDLIWIAESDDSANPHLLQTLVAKMVSDPEIVLVYCQSHRLNEQSEITGSWLDFSSDLDPEELFHSDFVIDGLEYIKRFLIHRNTIPNASAVMFRKSEFQRLGGAPEHLRTNGDWLMWLKMLCYGKLAYVAEPLNYFRYHDQSVIARAHQNGKADSYSEQFDRTMRREFAAFLKKREILLSTATRRQNKYYISLDEGNEGIYRLKQREYVKGWSKVLYASLWPRLQSGFIKKALGPL